MGTLHELQENKAVRGGVVLERRLPMCRLPMYRRIDKRWLLGSFIHRSNPHHITGKNEVKEFTGMWPLKPRPVRIQRGVTTMTYRIYPTIDGQWRFGTRVYQTFIEARRALTQTSRRLRKERRAAMAQAHFSKTNLSPSLYRNLQLSLRSSSAPN